ncbi:hypothetical protein AGLY_002389 [Aphis glycines]|uniref:Uncharacterized protein n=1 Tax=Aphis glycines TaxID=307491 RepID=A0A6G0U4P0_APHGL|nr:hypothetical protein AGLY_002389 [Aphis glycines]
MVCLMSNVIPIEYLKLYPYYNNRLTVRNVCTSGVVDKHFAGRNFSEDHFILRKSIKMHHYYKSKIHLRCPKFSLHSDNYPEVQQYLYCFYLNNYIVKRLECTLLFDHKSGFQKTGNKAIIPHYYNRVTRKIKRLDSIITSKKFSFNEYYTFQTLNLLLRERRYSDLPFYNRQECVLSVALGERPLIKIAWLSHIPNTKLNIMSCYSLVIEKRYNNFYNTGVSIDQTSENKWNKKLFKRNSTYT